jgi:drug/metabolite transporter (DMT)-like permease
MAMSTSLRASLLMAASMAGFTFNDALIKSLGGAYGAGQVMLVRGAIMLLFLTVYIRVAGVPVPLRRAMTRAMALRTMGEGLGTVLFLYALFHMPFANVSAVLQALPLAVTLGAALFLRERVGIRRLSAIVVGFLGVLLIIRPGMEGFNIYALAVLGTVLFATIRDLATRRLPADVPSIVFSLLTTVAVSTMGAVMMFGGDGWRPMSLSAVMTLAGSATFLFMGYQCIILAMRIGEIATVAPFRYTGLLWAILLGIVFFGEIPDALTLLGGSIIVASGLYALYRERVVSRRAASANISAASPPPGRGT